LNKFTPELKDFIVNLGVKVLTGAKDDERPENDHTITSSEAERNWEKVHVLSR